MDGQADEDKSDDKKDADTDKTGESIDMLKDSDNETK
jgi:hypothetical protein